ncbi:hypothetical protein BT96DRAFT_1021518 [Gymnopus androsaceus JB14]|uniref:Thioester reductase (TE) domain-containing protein n=1 Tax=Gymnopus androsaceus JB14 TaxID=1447944 RepID=A0A6A4HG13_9AGAR|nr:hypothetical protein BT96DRAFT_1021518 [Gymnopus androsaceus JB14]
MRQEISQARREVRARNLSYDELVTLPYLDAVCRETMRLYPPDSTCFAKESVSRGIGRLGVVRYRKPVRARSSRHSSSIRFLFTSSIASAQSWDAKTQGLYPEEVVMDAKYAVGGGYGESKYVTERILAKSGLEATSFRLGQLTGGAPNGAWATSDWVPIIVRSSISIGTLPDAVGVVSWIPMDAVCSALLDVGFNRESVPIAVNVVHPRPGEKHLSSDSLPLVLYHEWVDAVEQHARNPTEKDTTNIPAVKLIDFYRLQSNVDDTLRNSGQSTFESAGLTPLRTTNVEKLSECMRTLQPLDETIIKKWVRYWIDAGF